MQWKTVEYRLDTLINDINKTEGRAGKIHTEFPNQRPEVWTTAQKSLLIHTILQGDLVPEIYMTKERVGNLNPKTIIDGKQRTTTVYEFVNNCFKLSKDTPPIEIKVPIKDSNGNPKINENNIYEFENVEVEIAGKKFKDLSDNLQNALYDFSIPVRELFNCSEKEITDLMFKLNNGKAMSKAQKAITKLGVNLGMEIDKITKNDFFVDRMRYTPAEEKRSEGMRAVLLSLMLLTGQSFNKLENSDLEKFTKELSTEWTQAQMEELNELFLILNECLPVDIELNKKVLTTVNIPILIMSADQYCSLAENNECTKEQYQEFLKYWVEEGIENPQFTKFLGKHVSDKANVEGRVDVMSQALELFLIGEKLPINIEETKTEETNENQKENDANEEIYKENSKMYSYNDTDNYDNHINPGIIGECKFNPVPATGYGYDAYIHSLGRN